MALYKNSNNEVYTLKDDGSQDLSIEKLSLILITQTEADILLAPPPLTIAENEAAITAKANEIILSNYSELKQRKLMSIAISLQDIVLFGGTLTTEQLATLQSIRDVNTWITAVRTIENTAISNGTLLADVLWGV